MARLLPRIDFSSLSFDQPLYLWLLIVPAVLFFLWVWQARRRWRDAARFRAERRLPVRERIPFFGGLLFWLCLIPAIACLVLAVARPVAAVSFVRTAGVDIVILQDGSASMHVPDVAGNRWLRSMAFLRVLGDSLRWTDDRVAMACFAHIAAPQIRLTNDPNTYFFFLDHLKNPPFPLEDDTTWDTNIELGIHWGLRVIDKDQEVNGRSPNSKAFLLISDGQDWSGEVEQSLADARRQGIPVYVVGVGTTTGGIIPEPPQPPWMPQRPPSHIRSYLDRKSLMTIATAGGGEYFELDRQGDRQIANQVISTLRRRAGSLGVQSTTEPLYWRCLAAAAAFIALGTLLLRERSELWLQLAGVAATMAAIATLTR
jgi:Ca-activated chloride channel family protein